MGLRRWLSNSGKFHAPASSWTPLPKVRCNLLDPFAKRLPLLRAVNPVQPDALAFAVVQDRDRVAVRDAHDAAGEESPSGTTAAWVNWFI